jgi:hypothetical protein
VKTVRITCALAMFSESCGGFALDKLEQWHKIQLERT